MGNTFHHATITEEYICVVINNIVAFAIKLRSEHFLGYRHTNAIRYALTKRARSGLYAWCITAFRMAWSF